MSQLYTELPKHIVVADENGDLKNVTTIFTVDENGNRKYITSAQLMRGDNNKVCTFYKGWYNLQVDNGVVTGYWGSPEEIWIPENNEITAIGDDAFNNCQSLKKIHLSSNITKIGKRAFMCCFNLDEINLDDIEEIDDYAFAVAKGQNFRFGNKLRSIGVEAFAGSFGGDLYIPASVETIASNAFANNGITSITVDSDNLNYEAITNCLIEKSSRILVLGCNNSVLPSTNITAIGEYAFYLCRRLTNITIPAGLRYIGNHAFYYSGLTSLSFLSNPRDDGPISIGAKAFAWCHDLESVDFSQNRSKITLYSYAFEDTKITQIILGSNVELAQNAEGIFNKCNRLEVIDIDDAVTMETLNFQNIDTLTNLRVLKLGNGVKSYENLLTYTRKLEELKLGRGITEMPKGILKGAVRLTNLTIPFVGTSDIVSASGVVASEETLFGVIFGDVDYVDPDDPTVHDIHVTLPTAQFISENVTKTYYIPVSLTSVKVLGGCLLYGAFSNCIMLKNILLQGPNNLGLGGVGPYIGTKAFFFTDINSLEIPKSVTEIGEGGLACGNPLVQGSGLTSLTIPFVGRYHDASKASMDKQKFIGYMFGNNQMPDDGTINITAPFTYSCKLPKTLIHIYIEPKSPGYVIPEYAFFHINPNDNFMHNLASIDLSKNVYSISNRAFENCVMGTLILRKDGLVSLSSEKAFGQFGEDEHAIPNPNYSDSIQSVQVPANYLSAYESNINWQKLQYKADNPNGFISFHSIW